MERRNGESEGAAIRERFGTSDAILDVMQKVREAIFEMLTAAKLDPTKVRESARALGLDRTLVWRTTRFLNASDILAVTQDIPTRTHVDKICRACAEHGVSETVVERARAAIDTFERVVAECAGNREYFEAMVSGFSYDDVTQRQESARKLGFLSNLAIWGVQAAVDFKTLIYAPSESDPDQVDSINMSGLVDFKRSRSVAWTVHRVHGYFDDGSVAPIAQTPLQPVDGLPATVPLVYPFCSQPPPELIPIKTNYGTRYDLPVGKFGKAGTVTCVFGAIGRGLDSRWRIEGGERYSASMNDLHTPSELVVHDVFIHRDLRYAADPDVMVLDRLGRQRGYNPLLDDESRLPLSSPLMRVSPSPAGSHLSQFPAYSRLLQFAFERAGWSLDEFTGYRFSMPFPPVPSAVVVRLTLAEKPY